MKNIARALAYGGPHQGTCNRTRVTNDRKRPILYGATHSATLASGTPEILPPSSDRHQYING